MLFIVPLVVGAMLVLPLISPSIDVFANINYGLAKTLLKGIGGGFKSLAVPDSPPTVAISFDQARLIFNSLGDFNQSLRLTQNSVGELSTTMYTLTQNLTALSSYSDSQALQHTNLAHHVEGLERELACRNYQAKVLFVITGLCVVALGIALTFLWRSTGTMQSQFNVHQVQNDDLADTVSGILDRFYADNPESKKPIDTAVEILIEKVGTHETKQSQQEKDIAEIKTSISSCNSSIDTVKTSLETSKSSIAEFESNMKSRDAARTREAEIAAQEIHNVNTQVSQFLGKRRDASQSLNTTITAEIEVLVHTIQDMRALEVQHDLDLDRKVKELEEKTAAFKKDIDDHMTKYNSTASQCSKQIDNAPKRLDRAEKDFREASKKLTTAYKQKQDLVDVCISDRKVAFKTLMSEAEQKLKDHIVKYRSLDAEAAVGLTSITEKIKAVIGDAATSMQEQKLGDLLRDLQSEIQSSTSKLAALSTKHESQEKQFDETTRRQLTEIRSLGVDVTNIQAAIDSLKTLAGDHEQGHDELSRQVKDLAARIEDLLAQKQKEQERDDDDGHGDDESNHHDNSGAGAEANGRHGTADNGPKSGKAHDHGKGGKNSGKKNSSSSGQTEAPSTGNSDSTPPTEQGLRKQEKCRERRERYKANVKAKAAALAESPEKGKNSNNEPSVPILS